MKLVYALTFAGPREGLPGGLEDEALSFVNAGDVAAIVGEVAATPAISASSIERYDALIRELAHLRDALLPSRFGVVLPDDVSLRDMLSARSGELSEALSLVRGREQMTLRVFGEPSRAPMPVADPSLGPGARYLHARKAERERSLAMPEIQPLRAALGELLRAEKSTPHDAPPLLATVAHLIDRGRDVTYRDIVAKTQLSVTCTVSGPWPAYAFAPEVWS